MSPALQLNELLQTLTARAKDLFQEHLHSVILYGSYARGDFDDESDVDILLLVDLDETTLQSYRIHLDRICGDLLYDYGYVVSITEKSIDTYNRYLNILPFYQNVSREGIKIA